MGGVTIQGIQLYTGHGGSFGGENSVGDDLSATYRAGFTGGVTLGVAGDAGEIVENRSVGHKLFAVPINMTGERVANGIWSVGGEVGGRLDLMVVHFDVGTKVTALTGHDEAGVGVTPFGRLGFGLDIVNLEGGALAYSGHSDLSAGRGYVMANLNLGWLFGVGARAYSIGRSEIGSEL